MTQAELSLDKSRVGWYTTRVSLHHMLSTNENSIAEYDTAAEYNIQERPMQSSLYTKPPEMPEKQIQVQCYRRSQLCVRLGLTRAHDSYHHPTSLYRPIHPPSTVMISPET